MRLIPLTLVIALLPVPTLAVDEPPISDRSGLTNLSLQLENDAFTFERRDRWYSNGIKFDWSTNRSPPPDWLEFSGKLVPWFNRRGSNWWGWSLQQRIFTPENITDPEFPPDDRPYAGWLNLSFSMATLNGYYMDRFHIGVGLVGQGSLAEEAQDLSHELIGSEQAVGWDTQLPNEPTLLIAYDRQWRLGERSFEEGYGSDWVPSTGVLLSNAITQAEVGLFWRFGKNMPDDFGPPRIAGLPNGAAYFRPTAASGWYFCIGVNGSYVPHNLFLDGTVFSDSPSVDSEPLVGEAFAGFIYYIRNLRFSYVFVERSKEFEAQESSQSLGAITLTWSL